MSDLRIVQVENGFIVDESTHMGREAMVRNMDETHVFNGPEELGAWVTDYYIGLERKREQEVQRAEDHHE